jgi:hypothetical protein
MIGLFVGYSRIFLPGILIFKGLTALSLYKSFGVKGLKMNKCVNLRSVRKAQKPELCTLTHLQTNLAIHVYITILNILSQKTCRKPDWTI